MPSSQRLVMERGMLIVLNHPTLLKTGYHHIGDRYVHIESTKKASSTLDYESSDTMKPATPQHPPEQLSTGHTAGHSSNMPTRFIKASANMHSHATDAILPSSQQRIAPMDAIEQSASLYKRMFILIQANHLAQLHRKRTENTR